MIGGRGVSAMTTYRLSLFVFFIATVHAVQGLFLLAWPESSHATPMYLLVSTLWVTGTSLVLFAASLAVATTVFSLSDYTRWVALLPQQVILIVSAAGSVAAVVAGEYLDGTMIAWSHIFVDQAIVIGLPFIHLAAIVRHVG